MPPLKTAAVISLWVRGCILAGPFQKGAGFGLCGECLSHGLEVESKRAAAQIDAGYSALSMESPNLGGRHRECCCEFLGGCEAW